MARKRKQPTVAQRVAEELLMEDDLTMRPALAAPELVESLLALKRKRRPRKAPKKKARAAARKAPAKKSRKASPRKRKAPKAARRK